MVRGEPWRLGRKEILCSSAKHAVPDDRALISVVTGEAPAGSDVDLLVSFGKDADWDLFDWVDMIEELKGIFGRGVDLVEKNSLRNPFRRHYILNTQKVIWKN